MAKRQSLKCDRIANDLVWSDRDSKKSVYTFPILTVHPDLKDKVYEYGVRQIIADGAANAADLPDRIRMMGERAASLIDGTWGTRAPLPDGDIFRAMLAVRGIEDSPDVRARWKNLDAKQRRAIGDRADIRAKMETVPVADTDDLLDSMMGD